MMTQSFSVLSRALSGCRSDLLAAEFTRDSPNVHQALLISGIDFVRGALRAPLTKIK
jgi:hypothetical protein